MSAPAEALNRFWEDLRTKSRVKIEHPDLPEELKTAAAEMAMALWSSAQAQAQAQESLASFRDDVQADLNEAKAQKASAESDRDAAQHVLKESRQAHNDALNRINELEQLLASANAANTLLGGQLQQARADQTLREQKLEDARREFAAELEKMRGSVKASDARYQAAEKRALLEIDRERTNASKLQKELAAVRASFDKATDKHSTEVSDFQKQIGELRQNTGLLEGLLQSLTTNYQQLERNYMDGVNKLSELRHKLLASEANAIKWQNQAHESLQRLEERKKITRQKKAKKISLNP